MSRTSKIRAALFVFLFFYTVGMISLILSRPQGPHGGVIKKAGDYFIEMKNSETVFNAYLLNQKLEPVNIQNVFGEVKFIFPDSTDMLIQLRQEENDVFVCDPPKGFFTCKVTFTIIGKSVSAKFVNSIQTAFKK